MLSENHRRKTCYQMVLMVVKCFETGKIYTCWEICIAMLQGNTTWLQLNVLIIYSYIITSEGKKLFQMKGSRNAVVTES